MKWLALDVGGANLKLGDGKGYAASYAFNLWEDPDQLERELRSAITEAPAADHLAVTMTGELADCFETKTDGVLHILNMIAQAADGRHTRVFLNDGRLVSPTVARSHPLSAASSNWLALATFAGRYAPQGDAVLFDVGSTTCDIVPLFGGRPTPAARDDTARLIEGELCYTGIERSPICSIVQTSPYRGQQCPVTQEVFATSRDVYLTLGDLIEDPLNNRTADGRPATRNASRIRLGRMIGASAEQFAADDALALARHVAETQVNLVKSAAARVLGQMSDGPRTVILSGHGEFLAKRVLGQLGLEARLVSLASELSQKISRCAPAHALGVLAGEGLGGGE